MDYHLPSEPGPTGARMVTHHWALITATLTMLAKVMNGTGARAPQLLRHATYRFVQTELSRAEAMMRRVLVLIAVTLNLPSKDDDARAEKPAPTRKPSAVSAARGPRTPMFSLVDPVAANPQSQPKRARPRIIDILSHTPTPKPTAPAPRKTYTGDDMRPAAPIARRLTALNNVLQNPGLHAGRMARWLQSSQPLLVDSHPHARYGRPIRYGPAPGASKRRQGADGFQNYLGLTIDAHKALDAHYFNSS